MAAVSLTPLSFFFFLIVTLISIPQVSAEGSLSFNCGSVNGGNDTASKTYTANVNALLLNISTNAEIDYGFYNFSYGENADKVNAIALCRGDVEVQDCRTCLTNSRGLLFQMCPNQKEGIAWYDNCMLRFSNRSIFGTMETLPHFYLWNTEDALQIDKFNQVLTAFMRSLRTTAASGDSRRKFAAGNAKGPSNQTIYGLVQCTPDLSRDECDVCLSGAISEIPKCCDRKKGGRVVRPSCSIRYESYSFFQANASAPPFFTPLSNSTPPLPPSAHSMSESAEAQDEISSADSSLQLDFETIRVATNDFSDENKLGQGGFGLVYMGRLYNGQEIAVKRLSGDSGQGDIEFKNEVLLLAKLQHRNLVKLIGFCLENRERLLVYEFVPNKSLDYFIFDPIKREPLNWEKRFKIIEGIARGLLYLHQDSRIRIIHRDLKASNILLDGEMNPKISDFGVARLFVVDQTQGNTSKVVGTYGYMAPEYILHGQFSIKSDVFSFGVLVLEIVSGQKNGEFRSGENIDHLVSAAWKAWKEGITSIIVDPTLINKGSRSEIMRCIHLGLLCVQENVAERPTMASIVTMLSTYSVTLPLPSEPAFYLYTSLPAMDLSSSKDQSSVNEVSISEQEPR